MIIVANFKTPEISNSRTLNSEFPKFQNSNIRQSPQKTTKRVLSQGLARSKPIHRPILKMLPLPPTSPPEMEIRQIVARPFLLMVAFYVGYCCYILGIMLDISYYIEFKLGLFDISISNIDCRYIDTFEKYRYRYRHGHF